MPTERDKMPTKRPITLASVTKKPQMTAAEAEVVMKKMASNTVVTIPNVARKQLATVTPLPPTTLPPTKPKELKVEEQVQDTGADIAPNMPDADIVKTKADYLNEARKLGRNYRLGETSLAGFAELATEAGARGTLFATNEDNPTGDAQALLYRFRYPDVKKPIINEQTTDDSFRNNAKKLSWYILLGNIYKNDAKGWLNDAIETHNECAADPVMRKSMRTGHVYESVLHVVRKQLDTSETAGMSLPLMDKEEIAKHMQKDAPSEETNIGLLIDAYKKLNSANEGKKANSKRATAERKGLHDATVTDIMQAIQDFVEGLTAAERSKFMTATSGKRGRKVGAKNVKPAKTLVAAGNDDDDDTGDTDDNGDTND